MFLLSSLARAFRGLACGRRRIVTGSGTESAVLVETGFRPTDARDYQTVEPRRGAGRLSFRDDFVHFFQSKKAFHLGLLNLLVYIAVAIVGYSYVFESWPIVDSVYFSVVVFTTIGYGDLAPSTDISRIFTILFAAYGILILGLFLSLIGEVVIEFQEEAIAQTRNSTRKQVTTMFSEPESQTDREAETSQKPEKSLFEELCNVALLEAPIVIVITIIAVLIGVNEGWSVVTSIYFCFITSTTVGFGDLHPDSQSLKIVAIFFLPVAVAVFGEVLGRLAGVYFGRKVRAAEKEFLNRQIALCDLEMMDVNMDGQVSMGEFLSFMLVAMQKVEKEDIDELRSLFHKLDASNDGYLNKHDLALLAKRRKESNVRR